eukprot:COSAG06_NODE_5669_length_3331_cov_2.810496_2_plen_179_part_00
MPGRCARCLLGAVAQGILKQYAPPPWTTRTTDLRGDRIRFSRPSRPGRADEKWGSGCGSGAEPRSSQDATNLVAGAVVALGRSLTPQRASQSVGGKNSDTISYPFLIFSTPPYPSLFRVYPSLPPHSRLTAVLHDVGVCASNGAQGPVPLPSAHQAASVGCRRWHGDSSTVPVEDPGC